MIEFVEASRRFGHGRRAVHALRGITLAVPPGRITAIVGPNGAGKSTLFALALGFIGPTGGHVRIAGEDPRSYVRRRGAGYLPDRFALAGEWPVRRVLDALARMETPDPIAAVRLALERFGLESVANQRAAALSRGTLQRVGLAQSMLAPHELVVLDEPTQGLDPLWRVRLRDVLLSLREHGSTVLLASHDLSEVERLADRVVLLKDGRVAGTFDASQDATTRTWRLRLATPFDRVSDAFPDARAIENGTGFLIGALDEADLTSRLAALITSGAVLSSIEPASHTLETRIRHALEEPGD